MKKTLFVNSLINSNFKTGHISAKAQNKNLLKGRQRRWWWWLWSRAARHTSLLTASYQFQGTVIRADQVIMWSDQAVFSWAAVFSQLATCFSISWEAQRWNIMFQKSSITNTGFINFFFIMMQSHKCVYCAALKNGLLYEPKYMCTCVWTWCYLLICVF